MGAQSVRGGDRRLFLRSPKAAQNVVSTTDRKERIKPLFHHPRLEPAGTETLIVRVATGPQSWDAISASPGD